MEKIIDLNKSIYELHNQYPEILEFMKDLGFRDISPAMLNTAGRFMTIPKGAAMKKLDLKLIKEEFEKKGFTVISD